ncbi:MAG: GGDEF domain-containing protein [Polyangiaceae bacterium]
MCPSSASGVPPPRESLPTLTLSEEHETVSQLVAAHAAMPRDRGVLIRISGVDAGRVIGLDASGTTVLGRSKDCNCRLDDASLSRTHAQIIRQLDTFVLEDLQSRNGTYRNDERVERARLRDGDRIRLGIEALFRFQIVDEQEEQVLRRVYESSVLDGLTGVHNRKYLDERMYAEAAFALRHNGMLSLIMIDIDHFKRVNDTYGHPVGDSVLRSLTSALRQALRSEDVLARYGGEELAVLVRGIDHASACRLGERLREVIEQCVVQHEEIALKITASLGVASLSECDPARTPSALVALADERLYQAKQSGRNRVVGL